MAYNIKFLRGTVNEYNSSSKNSDTLYFCTDEGALYLGSKKFTNGNELAKAISDIASNASDIEEIQAQLETLLGGDGEGEGTSIQDMIDAAVSSLEAKMNELLGVEEGEEAPELDTDADNIVEAINEVLAELEQAKTDLTVACDESTPSDVAKRYVIKQGATTITTIDIPKDMVIESGKVIEATGSEGDGIEAGDKVIELTIANKTNSKIYIPVKSLVDIYTAENATGAKVIVTVDNATNKISATISAGAVTATELAADAVETAKIKDSAVTTAKINDGAITNAKITTGTIAKDKLVTSVQTSLGLADSAVQDIKTGTAQGTIAVDGSNVSVNGLKSAAYTEAGAYDPAGSASAAQTAAINSANGYTDTALTWGTIA